MPRLAPWLPALLLISCKDAETVANEQKINTLQARISDGRAALDRGEGDTAAEHFKAAAALSPEDPLPLVLLSQAERAQGNIAAALLALKGASALMGSKDASIRQQMAELYRENGNHAEAIKVLKEMLANAELGPDETLQLARMQAHQGDAEGAYQTLDRIQAADPDNPEAKVVEVEIQLSSGDELLATKLLDELIAARPDLVAARVVRARYLLANQEPQLAEADLAQITGLRALEPEVVELKARAWNQMKRYEEAHKALTGISAARPRDVELMSLLAEVKLNMNQPIEAEQLVDKVLGIRPGWPRALFVRGLAQEALGDWDRAKENYEEALRANPWLGSALSRMWRIHEKEGRTAEAIATLERLLLTQEATLEEKAALSKYYVDLGTNLGRGKKLIDEVMRHDPRNARYRIIQLRYGKPEVKKKLGGKGGSGPVIIRGSRRRH
jgi:tetratricopeptide (TPR) repeat protein